MSQSIMTHILIIDKDPRIFVKENGLWMAKGRYSVAIEEAGQVMWEHDEKMGLNVSLFFVGSSYFIICLLLIIVRTILRRTQQAR